MSDWRDKLLEIVECPLCDEDGIRNLVGGTCDHIDYGPIAKRGIAKCMAALKEAKG